LIWAIYSFGGLVAIERVRYQASFSEGFYIPIVLGVLIWGGLGFGWLATRLVPEHQRRLVWIVWLRVYPIVHISWLSIGGFTVIGVVLALLGRMIAGADTGGLELVVSVDVLISFLAWAIGSFMLLGIWWVKLKGVVEEEYNLVGCKLGGIALWWGALLLWLFGCGVGFFGGILGTDLIRSVGGL